MLAPWIVFTLAAACLQAIRTAAQRAVAVKWTADAGNFARYVYGLPVALSALALLAGGGAPIPAMTATALGIIALGALAQVLATRALILAVTGAHFGTGVAYSKTDVVQAAAVEAAVLGARLSPLALGGIILSMLGVMLMAAQSGRGFLRALLTGWQQAPALWGLGAGAGYAVSGVCYRAAALELGGDAVPAAVLSLCAALVMQTVCLGVWLYVRARGDFFRVLMDWRVSGLAGLAGGLGSLCWFSALALAPVALVRTLGLSELAFSLLFSLIVFRERPRMSEIAGLIVLAAGIALMLNGGAP